MSDSGGSLLCVVGFPANTGFAWDFLEGLYARLATRVLPLGASTYVAYPEIDEAPRTLEGSSAIPVELDSTLLTAESAQATARFVREHGVRAVFFIDAPSYNPRFAALRKAGAEHIVVYDHTSGARTGPRGLKRVAKRGSRMIAPYMADEVLTVSDYVARRQVEIGLMPLERVRTVHNGLPVSDSNPEARRELRRFLDVPEDRLVVGAAARAAPEKGIDHLLRAFDQVTDRMGERGPDLVFFGDGPELGALREQAEALRHASRVRLPGYVPGAADLLEGADLCVVPSVWQDALPLSVLGSMARGNAVLATSVGGVPEMIEDGVSGVLVPAGDDDALAREIVRLLDDAPLRARLGSAARDRVREHFTPERQLDEMFASVASALSGA